MFILLILAAVLQNITLCYLQFMLLVHHFHFFMIWSILLIYLKYIKISNL